MLLESAIWTDSLVKGTWSHIRTHTAVRRDCDIVASLDKFALRQSDRVPLNNFFCEGLRHGFRGMECRKECGGGGIFELRLENLLELASGGCEGSSLVIL